MTGPAVLVTRTAPGAARTAAALRARGVEPVVHPMLEAAPAAFDAAVLATAQAVAVTSAHAAEAAAAGGRPVFAVGDATAAAVRAAGASDVRSAAGDAADLAARIAAALDPAAGPVAFARGRDVAGDLARALASAGFDVRPVVVYETWPVEAFSAALRARFDHGRLDAVLFHSRRGADAFGRAAATSGFEGRLSGLVAAAIGPDAGDVAAGQGFQRVATAAEPNENSLFEALFSVLASRS